MKISRLAALVSVVLCLSTGWSLAEAQPSSNLPVLTVDLQHFWQGGAKAPAYVIAPGVGFVADATGYDFSLGGHARTPNVVRLTFYEDKDYRFAWQASGRIELTPRTLQAVGQSKPFSGLKAGDRANLAIGFESVDPKTQNVSFNVFWMADIEVETR